MLIQFGAKWHADEVFADKKARKLKRSTVWSTLDSRGAGGLYFTIAVGHDEERLISSLFRIRTASSILVARTNRHTHDSPTTSTVGPRRRSPNCCSLDAICGDCAVSGWGVVHAVEAKTGAVRRTQQCARFGQL